MKDAASPYADPIVFLFIGGFILAACVERWRLHERIALSIASVAGGRPVALVGGFMIASMLISMWISNTATTLMLAPIAIGAARAMSGGAKADLALGGALTLGVAHAATIGGSRHACWNADKSDCHRLLRTSRRTDRFRRLDGESAFQSCC